MSELLANTHSAGHTLRLQARLEALERESSNFLLAKAQWEKDKATLEQQLRQTINERDAAIQAERIAKSTATEHSADELRKTQIERDRYKRQLDIASDNANAQINQLEITNTQLNSKISQLSSELSTKENETSNAQRESAFMRENLERVVKELVERNKRTEAEGQDRLHSLEIELQELLEEHKQQTRDVLSYRGLLNEAKEEVAALEAQVDNAKAVNQQLVHSMETLQRRLASSEEALRSDDDTKDAIRRAEEETRADLEAAVAKLERADSHIKALSDEAAATNVALVKQRHQLELAEEAAMSAKTGREELLHRMFHLLRSVGEETDKLAVDVDEAVGSLREMSGVGDPAMSRVASNGPRAPICSPPPSSTDASSANTETTIFTTAMRVRDTIALLREDVILVQRGIVEEALHKREKLQQFELSGEAFRNERQAVQQLTATISELEAQLNVERDKVAELEGTVHKCNEWMAEAVEISNERSKRTDALLNEKRQLEESVAAVTSELKSMNDRLVAAQASIDALQSKNNGLQIEVKQHLHLRGALQDELMNSRALIEAARRKQEAAESAVSAERENAAKSQSRIASLETELQVLRGRLEDSSARLDGKDQHTSLLEQNCTQLRDQLFAVQKKYDDLLRRGDNISSGVAASVTPSKQLASPYRSLLAAQSAASPMMKGGSAEVLVASSLVHVVGGQTPTKLRGISQASAASHSGIDRVQNWERRINSLLQQRSSYE